jgi:hypothetical protein
MFETEVGVRDAVINTCVVVRARELVHCTTRVGQTNKKSSSTKKISSLVLHLFSRGDTGDAHVHL